MVYTHTSSTTTWAASIETIVQIDIQVIDLSIEAATIEEPHELSSQDSHHEVLDCIIPKLNSDSVFYSSDLVTKTKHHLLNCMC